MKILIQGYYGFGNLGDDLLLKVTHEFIKNSYPEAELFIFSNSTDNKYLEDFVEGRFSIIDYSFRGHFDLIIHGGGGVHYDYNQGTLKDLVVNLLIKLFGYKSYLRIYKAYKRIKAKENITTSYRIGIGIGVGEFTKSSKVFSFNIVILAGYNHLFVRDSESYHQSLRYLKESSVKKGADLAFATDFWRRGIPSSKASDSRSLGIVLRRWDRDHDHIKKIKEIALGLKSKYKITYFFFDKSYDEPVLDLFQNEITKIWDPFDLRFEEFTKDLAAQDLIITSRFHGALIAAAFNIPSIAIAIEPKLKSVTDILPSTRIIDLPIDGQQLEEMVIQIFTDLETYKSNISEEFERNRSIVLNNLKSIADKFYVTKV